MWQVIEAISLAVAKSVAGHLGGSRDVGPAHRGGLVRPFCTVRDLREVLHSFCYKYHLEPLDVLASRHWAINLESMHRWLDHGAVLVSYEDLHPTDDGHRDRLGCRARHRPTRGAGAEGR